MPNVNAGPVRKLAYSFGSIAYGVKDNGFSTFLMLYFNQVLGMPAIWVGTALLIAMAIDAVTDPYVGHISDRWKSKLGRRHPFMYFAILPAALVYFYLWNPPAGLSQGALFMFLLAMAVLVRLVITLYEVPNSAMVAELEMRYDKRTSLAGLRSMMGWLGGVIVALVAYVFFLVPTVDYDVGVLNEEGYRGFALFAVIVMMVTMAISALSTHPMIKHLPQADQTTDAYGFSFVQSVKQVFSSRSFQNLFLASLFSMMVFGVTITLQLYFGTYFFGLTSKQMGLLALVMIPSALCAYPLVALLSKGREKKNVAIMLTLVSIVAGNLVIFLKLLGLMPPTGSSTLFYLLIVNAFVGTTLLIALQIILVSMTADLVEDTERKTGHRAEGLYFAAFTFTRKVVTGLGMFFSGILIGLSETRGEVMNEETMNEVAIYYIPIVTALYLISILFLRGYTLTRQEHDDNVKALHPEALG